MQATIRARSTPLGVTGSADRLFTNSPASASPSTRSFNSTTPLVASGGTGSYAWTRISGSTLLAAISPSSASTNIQGTDIPINTTVSAVFRVTSGSETVDRTVQFTYDSGL
jgi:hypothetical protein